MPKIVIRQGVFETNSSSVHALAFIDDEAFDAWKNYGAYINIGSVVESDYSRNEDSETYPDISDKMILKRDIDEVRNSLPQESYYETENDCLLEAGIFPYAACSEQKGKPSAKWANICGGLTYIDYTETDEGYNIEAMWYAW